VRGRERGSILNLFYFILVIVLISVFDFLFSPCVLSTMYGRPLFRNSYIHIDIFFSCLLCLNMILVSTFLLYYIPFASFSFFRGEHSYIGMVHIPELNLCTVCCAVYIHSVRIAKFSSGICTIPM